MDIVSNQNNNASEFSFAKVYLKEVLVVNGLLFLVLNLFLTLTTSQIVYIAVFFVVFSGLLLYILGTKRKKGIEKIASLIEAIKKDKYISVNEIKLAPHLTIIENDLKEMFKKNQNDLASIKRLAQSRTDFLGNVSHELRTPIFTIQGFLETLLNGAINDEKVNRRFLEKAVHHTENLNALLNDLIDISMIESGQMRMLPKYFNISQFINTVIEELESLAADKGLKMAVAGNSKRRLRHNETRHRYRQLQRHQRYPGP